MIAPVCVVAIAIGLGGPAPVPVQQPTGQTPAETQPPEPKDPIRARAEAHFEKGLQIEKAMPEDDPPKAKAMLEEARREYMLAHEAFTEAYDNTKEPLYLYARAQAARAAGRCDLALPDYDAFLATRPDAETTKYVLANRARCTSEPPPKVAPAPAPKTSTPAHDSKPADAPRRKWIRDPAGGVLVALGGVTTIIGVSLIAFAVTRDGTADSAFNEDEYINRKHAALVQHRVGIAAAAVGGAMLVAGVTRWGVLAARERKQRVRAGVAGSRRGAALTVSVWF